MGKWVQKNDGVFEYAGKHAIICVVKGHIMNPENWVMHCKELAIDTMQIGRISTTSAQEAKAIALSYAARTAELILEEIRDVEESMIQ